jgi:hypothetical protein
MSAFTLSQGFVDLPIPEMTDAILHLTDGRQVVSKESFIQLAENRAAMDQAKEKEEKALKEVFSWMDDDGNGMYMYMYMYMYWNTHIYTHTLYIHAYRACGCGQAEVQDVGAADGAGRERAAPPADDG